MDAKQRTQVFQSVFCPGPGVGVLFGGPGNRSFSVFVLGSGVCLFWSPELPIQIQDLQIQIQMCVFQFSFIQFALCTTYIVKQSNNSVSFAVAQSPLDFFYHGVVDDEIYGLLVPALLGSHFFIESFRVQSLI